jgi:hypothetical protein
MDRDTFSTTSKFEDEYLSQVDLFVDQTISLKDSNSFHSATETRTLAVVDRTGVVESAAKTIASSRLARNCMSPYSPDLVLINEYVKDAFSSACLQYASNIGPDSKIRYVSPQEKSLQTKLQQAESKGQVKIHRTLGTELSIVELLDP